MSIPQRVDADAAQKVQILRATFIDQVHTLSANKEDWIAFVCLQQQLRFCGANLIQLRQFSYSSLLGSQATITSVPCATRLLHRSGREPAASAGKIRTRFTPCSSASRHALSLGNMPPEMIALFAISAIWSMLSHR